jgi:hypothetical protein
VAATGLADIGARDTQPLVLGRRGEHFPEELAILGLQLASLPQRDPRLPDALRQGIPHSLELVEAGDARLVVPG